MKWIEIASRTSHLRIYGRPYEHNSVSQHQGCQIRGAWGANNGRHDRRSSSSRSPDWHVAARMFGSSWRHGREPANSRSSGHTIPSWSARVQQQPAIGAWERQRQRLARHSYLTSHTCEFQARKMEFQRLLQVWVQFEGFVKTLNPNEMLQSRRRWWRWWWWGSTKGPYCRPRCTYPHYHFRACSHGVHQTHTQRGAKSASTLFICLTRSLHSIWAS